MPRARLLAEWLAILTLTLIVAGWAARIDLTIRLDNAILDHAVVAGASPPNADIVIVAIDERSLAREGQWPWNRARVAALVDRIAGNSPRAVLLDVLFVEPSNLPSDAALAQSIRRAGNVALPVGLVPAPDSTAGVIAEPLVPGLADAAWVTGHVGIDPDQDGPVRRIDAVLPVKQGPPLSHLALALSEALRWRVPQPLDGKVLRLRPSGSYRTVPASAVLAGEVPSQFIAGKIVIVGATAQGLGDIQPVSSAAGSTMSGAELIANILQDAHDGGFVAPLDSRAGQAIAVILILSLFAAFWALRPAWCIWVALACGASALLLSYALAVSKGLWFAPGPLLLALIVAYPLWGWRRLTAINAYLMNKANRLVTSPLAEHGAPQGFDAVAKAVNRLDFLVDELSERRAFLARVVESTPDALLVFDAQGQLLTLNRRASGLLRAPAGELEGKSVAELLDHIEGSLTNDDSELQLRDGRVFMVSRSTGVTGTGWSDIHLAVLTDVTEQRRAEIERRHALEFLSHDMRAPQVAILGLTSEGRSRDNADEELGRIRQHARRTLELADTFVELARLGDTPLDIADTDLCAMADEAADRAFAAARDQLAQVVVHHGEEPIFASADGAVLARVLDNLVGNAIKYGGRLVTLSVEGDAAMACIEIADDGPGMPPERAADPFLRFGSRAGEGKGGAGLGLAFVAAAIAHHGGVITCSSKAGQGTRFRIELPLSGA